MTRTLRIAVPNKGSLAPGSRQLFTAAGFDLSGVRDRLFCTDHDNDVDFLSLRARDIPTMIAQGYVDAGITGRDLVADSGHELSELLGLGFGRSTVRVAVPYDAGDSVRALHGKRVATALPSLTARHLAELGVRATVVTMSGAVEAAVHLGVADAVVDIVQSGRTLAAHGLQAIGAPLVVSEAVLVAVPTAAGSPALRQLAERLEKALSARGAVGVVG
ncbi:ATP phosphoribosyltransferase [Micromonospora okii]|uniref:ATP phosphoribosyltransferase n=1 Tax=Micromonospora okii TaxID=1182970 RepID=UPI001E437CDE|nr:ATP phosphoribosyltransferase [Micromonospora okii]